ncbi:MAG: hypothetical protein QXH12_05750 [Candidatus Caldarchaeum sp.]
MALAYISGVPKMVFHRPDNNMQYDRPVLEGRRAVVYVSRIGHAFAVKKQAVLIKSLIPMVYARLGRRRLEKLLKPGQPPQKFRIWRNVDFKTWVLEQLSRPEIAKSIPDNDKHGLLRYLWYILKTGRCSARGDLNGLFRNLVKAYLSMPAFLRTSRLGAYLLKNAYCAKK